MAPAHVPALPPWLHSRRVPALGGVLAAAIVLSGWGFVTYQSQRLRADADTQTELYARVLEDQANRIFGSAELALNAVAETLALHAAADDPDGAGAVLRQALQGQPFLRSLGVVAADGRILASSNPADVGRRIPRAQLATGLHGTTLGPLLPVRDLGDLDEGGGQAPPNAGATLLPMVRPLPGTGGGAPNATQPWLVAALHPDYFANQYQLILHQTDLKAAMVSYQGQLIAGSAELGVAPGRSLARHLLVHDLLPRQERGHLKGAGLDGEPMLASFRSARLHPVALVVEMPERVLDADMAPVWQGTAAAVAALLALLGALGTLAWRSLRSHELAQADLESARESMAAQHAFTDRLFQLSPMPMVVKDLQGRFVRVNQAFCAFSGLTPQQAIGRTMAALYPAHLAAPHELQEQMALASGQAVAYEEQMVDGNGQRRDMLTRVTPYAGADGRIAGVIGCLMDVSDFREAEARTLEAKAAAERASTAKGEFLANISHELRTPLQSIVGFSELGEARTRSEAQTRAMFGDIHRAGQRMLALVNDLLDLSRLESTVGEITLSATDLAPALQQVCDELQPLAGQRQVRLHLAQPLPPLWADADVRRLQQVVRNVLANAIRFSPPGGTVDLGWHTEAGAAEHRIRVRDHGPGIPPEELEAIFEAFVQSSRTKSGAGGTGLGLAISRKIMQAHGGSIQADNADGGGAVFTLVLPALPHPVPASGSGWQTRREVA